ncbi:MAG: diguanylate cyclase [Clostridiales bacterium]|nr:diguanylate cyclase [Clostridiales bacterium]
MLIYIRRIKRLQSRALSDSVTGLLNSEGLRRVALQYFSSNTPHHAVVVMELKNWRQIVHTFGSAKSDQVLFYIARILRTSLSSSEAAARLSGGTLCFLIKNRQEDAIRARLLRIYESINQFNIQRKIPYHMDLIFGAYLPSTTSEPFSDMQEKALQMLDMEKNAPRFRFYHNNPTDEKAIHRWELIEQMDRSLANGDFLVYMQPKVRLGDGRIVGAEALVRWRHPQRGLLTPEMFVPLLEEYRLIHRFDQYLFEVVCSKMAQWKQLGMSPCPISVNLSLETLEHDHFLEPYNRIAQKYRVAPEYLEFELSEPILFEKPQRLRALVDEIHSYGFKCSLDHFGESAIPLQLLRELSIDTLKLDRSFFIGENNSRANRYIVEAILKITSQLQIHTVAEGIDIASQVQYLRQSGCDMIQGFYYFRPMPVDEFQKTAFENGQLKYVETNDTPTIQTNDIAPHPTGSNIIMFTFLVSQDRVVFSDIFSPLLYGQLVISEASALFAHSDLIHENDRQDFRNLMDRCCKNEGWAENTLRFYTNESRYEWMEVHMHCEHIASGGEDIISGTLVNMAGWKNEVNRWMEKANRDPLTGLYNRTYFEQFVSSALKKGAQTGSAIIFFDLDHFKQVNDTLGHMVGDDVLCFIAKRLLGTFRHIDVVARYAGDEFVVFVSGLERADLTKRLEELCNVLQTPYRTDTIDYPLSGSIGAAVYPDDGDTYEDLLDHADTAAYVAKEQGRAQFIFYDPSMESMAENKK